MCATAVTRIQLAPPFITEKAEIDSLINALGEAITATA